MGKEQLQHSITGGDRGELRPRAQLVEEWKKATYEDVLRYSAGSYEDDDGNTLYRYGAGARLVILGQEVMDTCQEPWANSTVDKAFAALGKRIGVQVLERGFGMGIVATKIMEHLASTGGKYTCIELNEQVACHAENQWTKRELAKLADKEVLGAKYIAEPNVTINIIRGEAFKETARLAAEGEKFDIIVSDTYPLSKEERSVNDLLDLEQLIKCLDPKGVFAFFGYHTGSDGTMNATQRSMIDRHFGNVNTTYVNVNPPPDYEYFNPPSGPVRRLPVIICTEPLQQFNSC